MYKYTYTVTQFKSDCRGGVANHGWMKMCAAELRDRPKLTSHCTSTKSISTHSSLSAEPTELQQGTIQRYLLRTSQSEGQDGACSHHREEQPPPLLRQGQTSARNRMIPQLYTLTHRLQYPGQGSLLSRSLTQIQLI